MTQETTFGQDIDTFIATYIPESKKRLAAMQLNIIVIKAMKQQLIESYNSSNPSI